MERNEELGPASAPAGVRVTDVTGDVGVEEARAHFGGVDIPATIAGALVFRNVNLPQWFDSDALTGAAIATGLVALAVMLLAGWLGGRIGERYHRRADSLVARTRPGAVGVPRRIVRAS